MVKKKASWIDKKRATHYTLVYRNTEDHDEEPEREFVPTSQLGTPDKHEASGGAFPEHHPLAFLHRNQQPLSEERRREIIELGFPDDGYDYLKHLRKRGSQPQAALLPSHPLTPEKGTAEEPETAGTGAAVLFIAAPTFVPPTPDMRTYDARRLAIKQQAQDEDEVANRLFEVTAYSRQVEGFTGAAQRELQEMERLMEQFEDMSDADAQEGIGDLEDDFVLGAMATAHGYHEGATQGSTATQQGPSAGRLDVDTTETARGVDPKLCSDSNDEEQDSSVSGDDRFTSDTDEDEHWGVQEVGKGAGSIASTYWRPERTDRNDDLSIIDERFERLAVEYDDDEIGDLDDDGEETRGDADAVKDFGDVLESFLQQHSRRLTPYTAGTPGSAAPAASSAVTASQAAAASPLACSDLRHDSDSEEERRQALQKAREYIHRCEAVEDPDKLEGHTTVPLQGPWASVEHDRWDCESVLSLLSNTDNHPGRIQEPPRRRKVAIARSNLQSSNNTAIQLSELGIPKGYGGKPRTAAPGSVLGTAPEASHSEAAACEGAHQGDGVAAVVTARVKGESAEQKRSRKTAVKEQKRASREVKKEFKQAFSKERVKQQHHAATNTNALVSVVPIA